MRFSILLLIHIEEKILPARAFRMKGEVDALNKSQAPIVLANAAQVQLHQGDATQALKLADDAIKGDPFLKEGYEVCAKVLKKLGRDADAMRDQQKAATLILHLDL